MSIKSLATPEEELSPFYDFNKQITEKWKGFSESNDGQISGNFNPYIVDLNIKIKTSNSILNIVGFKQLNSGSSGVLPLESTYTEYTNFRIKFSSLNIPKSDIRKKSIFDRSRYLLNSGYIMKTKDFRQFEKFSNLFNNFIEKTEFEINYIKLNPKKGEITIRFKKLIESKDVIENIIIFLTDIKTELNKSL